VEPSKQSSATVQRSKSSFFVPPPLWITTALSGFVMTGGLLLLPLVAGLPRRVAPRNDGEEAVKTQKQSSAWVVLAAGLLCSHHR